MEHQSESLNDPSMMAVGRIAAEGLCHRMVRIAAVLAVLAASTAAPAATPCPDTVRVDVDGSSVDYDAGWTGIAHDYPWFGITLTMDVSGCAGSTQGSCGQCTLSGPVANAGGAVFENRRCVDETWTTCTDDGDCTAAGAAGPCHVFLGPPAPFSVGGVAVCATSEIPAPVTGTVNVEAGSMAASLPLVDRIHIGLAIDGPCPRCAAGVCDAGPRAGQPCTTNAVHPFFGNVSFDCPPDPGAAIDALQLILPLSTGVQSKALSAASPDCTGFGVTGAKCLCDSCNNAAATPCANNADCAAVGTTICGGLRCLDDSGVATGTPCTVRGTNTDAVCDQVAAGACDIGTCVTYHCVGGPHAGVGCYYDSDCGECVLGPRPGAECATDGECGGTCGRPGEPTKPNTCPNGECIDASVPGAPPLGQGPDEGVCETGPDDHLCAIETFRGCTADSDCPAAGDSCVTTRRDCFFDTDELGPSSRTVTATAMASPPVGHTATVSLGSLFCMPPSKSFAASAVVGLPGPGRLKFTGTTLTFGVSTSLCGSSPASDCREPAQSQRASVLLKNDSEDVKDKLVWRWLKGETTPKSAYGDPVTLGTGTHYALCIYDGTGLIASAAVPAGGTCHSSPCWQERSTSFKYKDSEGRNGGITKLVLKEGLGDGRAKITVQGKGSGLDMPDVSALASPLTVQLANSDGECWSAVYGFPPARRNDGEQFSDKAN